jgi:purine-binding chemotaxis protein CheW
MSQTHDMAAVEPTLELVTMSLDSYAFGIAVKHVHDILGPQQVAAVPLTCEAVLGSINLRGRIVTVLDLAVVLGLRRVNSADRALNVVIAHEKELYALMVDDVGEVMTLPCDTLEPLPPTFPAGWKAISNGIFKLPDQLLLTLEPERILAVIKAQSGRDA